MILSAGYTLSLLLLSSGPQLPAWIKTGLSGVSFAEKNYEAHWNRGWKDPSSGWMLVKTNDCDGSHKSIWLTRDRKLVKELWGSDFEPFAERSIGTFVAGVKMGDSTQALIKSIGGPTNVVSDGPYRRFQYRFENVKNGQGFRLENEYVFRSNKLVEVVYRRDTVPGCG